jgi:hypothetical protein
MRIFGRLLFFLFVTGAAACGSSSTKPLGPPTGHKSSPVKTPCEGGKALIFEQAKLLCVAFPETPVEGSSLYLNGEKPCSLTIDGPGMDSHTEKFDYTKPYAAAGASYDTNGHISRF